MVKVIALIKRKPGLSREEFLRHWHEAHPAFVRELPGLARYRQNHSLEHRKEWPYDGAAELWVDTVADVAAAFRAPAAGALREHEDEFIGELVWFLAEEHEIALTEETR
jgi:uncharacterized protein (TIGR02118 family)